MLSLFVWLLEEERVMSFFETLLSMNMFVMVRMCEFFSTTSMTSRLPMMPMIRSLGLIILWPLCVCVCVLLAFVDRELNCTPYCSTATFASRCVIGKNSILNLLLFLLGQTNGAWLLLIKMFSYDLSRHCNALKQQQQNDK